MRRRLLHLTLTVLAALLLVGVPQLPASAHAQLLSSDPANGSTLPTMPRSVKLVFSDPIDPNFAQIVIADGQNVARPVKPTGSGPTVIAAVPAEVPDGLVHVRYRVVSADGHPIAGEISFTVGSATPTPGGSADAPPHATASHPGSATQQPAQPSTGAMMTTKDESSSQVWMYALTGFAALVIIGGGAAILLTGRRRRP